MNTFRGYLELSALYNLDCLGRPILCALCDVLNLVNDVIAFEDFSKDDVTAIEPAMVYQSREAQKRSKGDCSLRNCRGNKELRPVGVLSSIGHAQQAFLGVLQLEVLVFKLVSVDRLAASSIPSREITTLNHKVLDDTVESRAFIAVALLACC